MAHLAIKGHATRGQEVIEILKMLGGKNYNNRTGTVEWAYFLDMSWHACHYYIDGDGNIECTHIKGIPFPGIFFTLEGFLEKFPYKVGDRVKKANDNDGYCATVISMDWDSDIREVVYTIIFDDRIGSTLECLSVDLQPYKEEGETFGECVEKTIQECLFGEEAPMYINEIANKRTEEIVQTLKPAKEIMDRKYNVEEYLKVWKETEKGLEVVVNDRFELKEDNGKFYIIKKPVQYPKTYEECIGLLPINWDGKVKGYKCELLEAFQKLLVCRDAYWKIAGEQMGLGKPWEPDWDSLDKKYNIYNYRGVIKYDSFTVIDRCLLVFPTEEMRDAFYENFKDLIEKCKEFL